MEDKRTLLAFLLIGLILLAIPYYYEWTGLAPRPQAQELDQGGGGVGGRERTGAAGGWLAHMAGEGLNRS